MCPSIRLLSLLPLVGTAFAQATFSRSPKRGLAFAPSPEFPQDDQIWVQPGSDLTWYYNYGWQPSPAFSSLSQSQFEYIPMIWGAPANDQDFEFLNNVTDLIKGGINITHVLGFNEPDGPWSEGGSNMSVSSAVHSWLREVAPLQEMGIKAGAPAVTATQRGLSWLADFMTECANCTIDFIPFHDYSNFSDLQDFISTIHTAYPTTKIWLTEYGYANVGLEPTQDYFNKTAQFFDSTDYIERYSWFGAFRSNASNVGPNGCFLDDDGKLTSIGSWYLGGAETNNIPSAAPLLYGNIGAITFALIVAGWIMTAVLEF